MSVEYCDDCGRPKYACCCDKPERTATNDQVAAVMLRHGTPEQQQQALEYCGISVPHVVRFVYEGVEWTAERLKNSRCHVHCKNTAKAGDGMMWSVPSEEMAELAWRIYHAGYEPTREDLFLMLSVIDSFRSLLQKPVRRQRVIARVLLAILRAGKLKPS